MANRNTYVPKHTLVKARRIRKVLEATLTNNPDCKEAVEEKEADIKFLEHSLRHYVLGKLGDNHTVEFGSTVSEFEALEVKYIKAPKIAAKQL